MEDPGSKPQDYDDEPLKPNQQATDRDFETDSDFDDNDVSKKGHVSKVYPMREISINLPFSGDKMQFNGLVSFIALAFLWGITIFCMADPTGAKSELGRWFQTTIQYFTWFYILGNPVMFAFIIWVAYRYGHIKLGHKNEEPEFSDMAYFSMLFSAGVGVGLFFYGVSEPLWHQGSNYYANAGYHTQDEVDQWALEITMYHWGFAAWSPYLIMALATGLASFCFDLPLTVRSCFYPILGEYVWGWLGDLLDSWSIVMTVAGICTSLGLGTIQLTTGLQRLGWIDPTKEDLSSTYVAIIWVITLFATISVVTGLKVGIKALSMLGFVLGCLILFLCFVMEKSYYLLDLLVQTSGFYLQWSFFQVPFWTDAFAALEPGEGRAIDGKAGESWWIGSWTVFYMAWWVSWTCFVGIFIGRISKNRTIRSVVAGVFLAPTAYALVWFSFMGGIGLRQSRQALELEKLGTDFYDNAAHFQTAESTFCYDVPQEDVVVDGEVIFTNTLLGITPVCKFDSANSESAWFNVMYSFTYPGSGDGNFPGFGEVMSGLSIFALAIYFITSSDSGSMVVDALASNGKEEHHSIQRIFWAFTEGSVATGLLWAGGADALTALQAASIVFGLPYNFFVFFMCWTVYKMCVALDNHGQEDYHDPKTLLPNKTWAMPLYGGIFNCMEAFFSGGSINPLLKKEGIVTPSVSDVALLLKNLLFPFVPLYSVYSALDLKKKRGNFNTFMTAVYALFHFLWIALFGCGVINYGFVAFAWTVFFINACILISVRLEVRNKLGISGNIVGDFVACSFMYPQGLLQMEKQLFELNESHLDKDVKGANEGSASKKEDDLKESDLILSA